MQVAPRALLLLLLLGAPSGGGGSGAILPAALNCSRSGLTVEVPEAAIDLFACPEYFTNRTCCQEAELAKVSEKLGDILRFARRVLEDRSAELLISATDATGEKCGDVGCQATGDEAQDADLTGDECSDAYARLLGSRSSSYHEARKAAEKGLELLESASMHTLCAACFVCSIPGKTKQVDLFTQEALASLQDRMGAIFTQQMLEDARAGSECPSRYIASLAEGVAFPAEARFVPEMADDVGGTPVSFMRWMDRVLSLLLELPSALVHQQSILQLAIFYSDRPDSEAFSLLHGLGAPLASQTAAPAAARDGGEVAGFCSPGQLNLFIFVPQTSEAGLVNATRAKLERDLTAWQVHWVVTASSHVSSLQRAQGDPALIWRRFEVRNLDAFAESICDDRPGWVGNFHAFASAGIDKVVGQLQQIGASPELKDLNASSWPHGFRLARPMTQSASWPSGALLAYMEAHADLRAALNEGRQLSGRRILVYTCTSLTFCGGHGDRLNGMLSAFAASLLSGRYFFIDAQRPVPLSLVLQPRNLDWRLFGTSATFPAAFNWNDDLAGFEADPRQVLDSQAAALRFVSNQRLTPAALLAAPRQAQDLGLAARPRLHADLFQLLFQPSPAFLRRLAARDLPLGRRIGIHFRAGDQMPEHWKDPPRHGLPELEESLDCAESLEASLDWESKFLLFADTDKVMELPRVNALRESGKLVWYGSRNSLVHIDRSPATLSVRGLLDTWAEWWTLAFDVDALVLCHSGFGATALELGPRRPAVLGAGCIRADGSTG